MNSIGATLFTLYRILYLISVIVICNNFICKYFRRRTLCCIARERGREGGIQWNDNLKIEEIYTASSCTHVVDCSSDCTCIHGVWHNVSKHDTHEG